MAERKLRVDAAVAAAIPHPRIRMLISDDQTAANATGLKPALDGASSISEAPTDSSSALELAVRQKLNSDPEVRISALLVRQIEGGVCLEGILETHNDLADVERLVRSVASVDRILNRLVIRPPGQPSS